MIDLHLLFNDFDAVSKRLSTRNDKHLNLVELKERALNFKSLHTKLQHMRAEQNKISKNYHSLGDNKELLNELKNNIKTLEEEIKIKEIDLNKLLLSVPNIPDDKTPVGNSEEDNVVLEYFLSKPTFNFIPKNHWDLTNWLDFDIASKMSKSRFTIIKNEGAKIYRALINFMLDFNSSLGFSEVITPVIVNERALQTTGQLPKFKEDMFRLERDEEDREEDVLRGLKARGHELYLIPTSEITLTNLYQDSILPAHELPKKHTASTLCFRREAGSASRDTRGIIRQHQFDKVELVALTHPDLSDSMQEEMLRCASGILKELGLHHRFVQLCSADLGFSASNTVDIEVWFPGEGKYREISSVSNTRDFQARRGLIRFKEDGKNKLLHTLNGSSLAIGRTLAAIMENYQKEDGSVEIPSALHPYIHARQQ